MPPPPDRVSRWRGLIAPAALAGAGIAACAYVAAVDPNKTQVFPACPFRLATGLDCPGCGMTRAVYALTQGDPVRALDHNVMLVVMLPLVLWAYASWAADRVGIRLPSLGWTWRPWMTWGAAALVLGFWVLRNIPAFSWLRSTSSV